MGRHVLVAGCLCATLMAAAVPAGHAGETASTPLHAATDNERRLPATLPLRSEPPTGADTWPTALGWLGIAGAAGGLWWWLGVGTRSLRRRNVANGEGVVRLSSQALTPHASVHAVRWNGEEYLLACTSQEVTLVARRPATTEHA